MIDIEELEIATMTHVRKNHNGDDFAVEHGKSPVSSFYGYISEQAVFFEN